MNWEQKAVIACKEKGLEVVGFDGGWVFIKNDRNEIYPVRESIVAMRRGEKMKPMVGVGGLEKTGKKNSRN